jgi:hypothetical protein
MCNNDSLPTALGMVSVYGFVSPGRAPQFSPEMPRKELEPNSPKSHPPALFFHGPPSYGFLRLCISSFGGVMTRVIMGDVVVKPVGAACAISRSARGVLILTGGSERLDLVGGRGVGTLCVDSVQHTHSPHTPHQSTTPTLPVAILSHPVSVHITPYPAPRTSAWYDTLP